MCDDTITLRLRSAHPKTRRRNFTCKVFGIPSDLLRRAVRSGRGRLAVNAGVGPSESMEQRSPTAESRAPGLVTVLGRRPVDGGQTVSEAARMPEEDGARLDVVEERAWPAPRSCGLCGEEVRGRAPVEQGRGGGGRGGS